VSVPRTGRHQSIVLAHKELILLLWPLSLEPAIIDRRWSAVGPLPEGFGSGTSQTDETARFKGSQGPSPWVRFPSPAPCFRQRQSMQGYGGQDLVVTRTGSNLFSDNDNFGNQVERHRSIGYSLLQRCLQSITEFSEYFFVVIARERRGQRRHECGAKKPSMALR
jgi:hypothetical protein